MGDRCPDVVDALHPLTGGFRTEEEFGCRCVTNPSDADGRVDAVARCRRHGYALQSDGFVAEAGTSLARGWRRPVNECTNIPPPPAYQSEPRPGAIATVNRSLQFPAIGSAQ